MIAIRRLLLIFALLGLVTPGFAALSANTVFEVRGTVLNGSPGPGVDTNGGGFVAGSGGTDRSLQNAAQVAVGGGTVTSTITTTVVTFTGGTYTVLAGDVGNIVQFISGTNVTAGFYQIASVGAGLNGTWTLDRTPLTSGTTTNAVANMGGALLTIGKLAGAMVASNKAYLTGTFSSAATATFAQAVAGGGTGAAPMTRLIGYGLTRGDAVHAAVAITGGAAVSVFNSTGAGFSIEQFDVDCASQTSSNAFIFQATFGMIQRCKAANFGSLGISSTASFFTVLDCEATGGTSGATAAVNPANTVSILARSFVHDNACPGVTCAAGGATLVDDLIVNNSGASSDGIRCGTMMNIVHNTIHNNGRNGINCITAASEAQNWRNNIISNNGGFGAVGGITTALPAAAEWDGNAYFSNTSGNRSFMDSTAGIFAVSPYTNVLDITLSVSPYVGPTTGASANFALNDTPGGGQACRHAGLPSTWPGNTGSTSYLDMGAVQTRSNIRIPRAAPRPKPKAKPGSKPKKKAVH